MAQGVKVVRPNAEIRRGVTLILRKLVEDFDNGFDHIFPGASEKELMEVNAAMEWLEQHAYDIYE